MASVRSLFFTMTENYSPEENAGLNQLASVPENKRRELLKLMLAGSVTGMAIALPGCGGGGNGAGATTFPPTGGSGTSTGTSSPASPGTAADRKSVV